MPESENMQPMEKGGKDYLKKIGERAKNSRISQPHQLTGLDVAKMLDDWGYRGLYMKLAKQFGETKLRMLAKAVAEQKNITNKGAYLMKILFPKDDDGRNNSK
jgi:hypothetical protein